MMGKDMELSPTGSISKLQYWVLWSERGRGSTTNRWPQIHLIKTSRKSFLGRRTLGVVEEKATDLTGDTSSGSNG